MRNTTIRSHLIQGREGTEFRGTQISFANSAAKGSYAPSGSGGVLYGGADP